MIFIFSEKHIHCVRIWERNEKIIYFFNFLSLFYKVFGNFFVFFLLNQKHRLRWGRSHRNSEVAVLNIHHQNRVLPPIHPQDHKSSFFHLITSLTLKPLISNARTAILGTSTFSFLLLLWWLFIRCAAVYLSFFFRNGAREIEDVVECVCCFLKGYTYAENTCCLVTDTNDSYRSTSETRVNWSYLEVVMCWSIIK